MKTKSKINKNLRILIEVHVAAEDLDSIDFTNILDELRGIGSADIIDIEVVDNKDEP